MKINDISIIDMKVYHQSKLIDEDHYNQIDKIEVPKHVLVSNEADPEKLLSIIVTAHVYASLCGGELLYHRVDVDDKDSYRQKQMKAIDFAGIPYIPVDATKLKYDESKLTKLTSGLYYITKLGERELFFDNKIKPTYFALLAAILHNFKSCVVIDDLSQASSSSIKGQIVKEHDAKLCLVENKDLPTTSLVEETNHQIYTANLTLGAKPIPLIEEYLQAYQEPESEFFENPVFNILLTKSINEITTRYLLDNIEQANLSDRNLILKKAGFL